MQRRPDIAGPSEFELRVRAASRIARRRAFTVSFVVLGSLILLNLYFYSQDHRSTWLLLDLVFAGILCIRAWYAFGGERSTEQRIQNEMVRMRGSAPTQAPVQPTVIVPTPTRPAVSPQYAPPRPDAPSDTNRN